MKLDKFDELVASFQKLPGVGKKSALRFAYFIVLQDYFAGINLAHNIENAISFLKQCSKCGALCEDELCNICTDELRDREKLCLVESPKDIALIEESGGYDGYYFVLSDPKENITKLKKILAENETKELIFALTPSLASDAISLYVEEELRDFELNYTKIAQGVPTGVSLENIDTLSLLKAIKDRTKI